MPQKKTFFFFLPLLGPLPVACGSSQPRGLVGAVATGLHQSPSNAGSKPHLRPTPQLTGKAGSLTHWARPGIEPKNLMVDSLTTAPQWELPTSKNF